MAWETFSGQSTQTASQDDWRNSILGFIDFTAAEPATPASSDRYVNTTTGVSNVTAQSVTANHVYQWNGASWTETVPVAGWVITNKTTTELFAYNGTTWVSVATPAGTDVTSFNGRTGAVVPQANDYAALQINNFNSQALTAVEKNNLATGFSLAGGTTSKTLIVSEDSTVNQSLQTTDSPTFNGLTLSGATSGFLKTDGGGVVSSQGIDLVSESTDGLQPQSNRVSTIDPSVSNDGTQGYKIGSYWVNTTTNNIFFCSNNATGAAVWTDVTQTASLVSSSNDGVQPQSNRTATVAPVATNDTTQGYKIGSYWIDTATDKAYICVDDTATTAVWIETTQSDAGTPLTTKGDLLTYSVSDTRLGIGPDNSIFTADSGEATGNAWKTTINLTSGEIGNVTFTGNVIQNSQASTRLEFNPNGAIAGDHFRFNASFGLYDSAALLDDKLISFENLGGVFSVKLFSDDLLTSSDAFTISRNGTVVETTTLFGNVVADSGNVSFSQIPAQPLPAIGFASVYNKTGDSRFYGKVGPAGAENKFSYFSDLPTSKGQILSSDGANLVKVDVGPDNRVLVADSGEAGGLDWTTLLLSLNYVNGTYLKLNDGEASQSSANIKLRNNALFNQASNINWIVSEGEKDSLKNIATFSAMSFAKNNGLDGNTEGRWSLYLNSGAGDSADLLVSRAYYDGDFFILGGSSILVGGYVPHNTTFGGSLAGDASLAQSADLRFTQLCNGVSQNGSVNFVVDVNKGRYHDDSFVFKVLDDGTTKGLIMFALDSSSNSILSTTDAALEYNILFDFSTDIMRFRYGTTTLGSVSAISGFADGNNICLNIKRQDAFFEIEAHSSTTSKRLCVFDSTDRGTSSNNINIYASTNSVVGGTTHSYEFFVVNNKRRLRQVEVG